MLGARTAIGDRVRERLRKNDWIVEKRSPKTDEAMRRAALLREFGIATVLDVGASVGAYGRELRGHGYNGRIVSFEPLSKAYARLHEAAATEAGWEAINVALANEDGHAELNVSVEDVWSSLLPRDERATTKNLTYVGTEEVRTARLDALDVLDGTPTWLKLDVQGFELAVLDGAEASLQHVAAIECEISLEPFYEGQPSLRDLVDALDDRDFRLIAISQGFVRVSGRAMWINGVFARPR